MPASPRTTSLRADHSGSFERVEHKADGCWAYVGESATNLACAKFVRRLVEDVVAYALLLTAQAVSRGDASPEVLIRAVEDPDEIGRPGPDAVFFVVPTLLRFIEARVVGVLGVEDALLDAHVASNAIALRKQLVCRDESCQSPIAVGHRVNGKEIEDEGAKQHQGMCKCLLLGGVVPSQKLWQQHFGLLLVGRSKDDSAPTALVRDDVVLFDLQMASTTSDVLEEQAMEVQQVRNAQRLVPIDPYERVEGVSITSELLLVAVAKGSGSIDDTLRPRTIEHDVLDRIRRRYRRDAGRHRKLTEQFWHLGFEQALLPSPGIDPRQCGTELERLIAECPLQINEASHETNDRIVVLN